MITEASFVAGTLVHTSEGLRPIEQITVGDAILSRAENGTGETAYKRVLRTFEFDDKEVWYVSWEDSSILPKLREGLTSQQFLDAHGQSFVVTTPHQLFWVVDSDEDELQWDESSAYAQGQAPKLQWVRADHLSAGMTLLLADGRQVQVAASKRIYKTDQEQHGWVDTIDDHAKGLMIVMSGAKAEPAAPVHAWRFTPDHNLYHGLVENPNSAYVNDLDSGSAPESWCLHKVYKLEIEDFQTYFVDKMGIWVHA